MAILKEDTFKKQVIDLTGPQGNAFYLLGFASKHCEDLGYDKDDMLDEMKSGDYEHLIKTFDEYFGCIIDLER